MVMNLVRRVKEATNTGVRALRRFCCSAVGGILSSLRASERRQMVQCIRCGSERTRRDGQTRLDGQRWRCND